MSNATGKVIFLQLYVNVIIPVGFASLVIYLDILHALRVQSSFNEQESEFKSAEGMPIMF